MPFDKKAYHREYNRQYMREWRRANPAEAKEVGSAWRERNPAKRLMVATRASARIKGLAHDIDESDLVCPETCPMTGITIDYTAGNGKTMEKPSVDRIDPTQGYVKGNVEVMSSLANTMKCKATPQQLAYFGRILVERYGHLDGRCGNNDDEPRESV